MNLRLVNTPTGIVTRKFQAATNKMVTPVGNAFMHSAAHHRQMRNGLIRSLRWLGYDKGKEMYPIIYEISLWASKFL